MTVRVYRSTDTDAPALRGNTPGDLLNLLEKCLVTGYGTKTPAGWTKPFVGTNIAAFKQGAGSNGMYLRVDDTSVDANDRSARVKAYETMSDVNTGSPDSFPTEAQFAGGLRWFTNDVSATNADARPWMIVADEAFFWIRLKTRPDFVSNIHYYQEAYCFGDIIPYKPGDSTHTVIRGNPTTTPNASNASPFIGNTISTADAGFYAARSYTNLGGSYPLGWHSDVIKGSTSWGAGALPFPHGPDGGLYLAPIWVHQPSTPYAIRGIMPGLWNPLHDGDSLGHEDTFQGSGDVAGRDFMWVRWGQNSAVAFETSDTWR